MGSDDEQVSIDLVGDANKANHMHKFKLYETYSNFYMIGWDKSRTFWRVLKIDRLEPSELNIIEDSATYLEMECYELLRRIHDGNKSTGGLKFVTMCYGIVGFVKFLGPYYMLLITKRRKIGMISGHAVYSIAKSEMVPIPNSTVQSNKAYSKNENRSFVNSVCKCKNVFGSFETIFIRIENALSLCILMRSVFQCSYFALIILFFRTSLSFGILPIYSTLGR